MAVPAPTAPPAPAAPPAPTAPPAPAAGALDILREQVFHVLEDLHQRSADRDSWTPQLDRYFFAQKHQQVKRVRALFEAAFAYAASHADHPHLRALVDSDGFADWISATHSMEQTLQLMSPPPAAVAPGALHRLRNAMAQLQLLRSAWPQALS